MKRKWIPTALGLARPPIRTAIPRLPSRTRAWEIARRLLPLLWRRRHAPAAVGAYLREQFEALGGLWIKVGQLLSLRLDIFPAAFCRELTQLQGRTVGCPGSYARSIVSASLLRSPLRRSLVEVFDQFEHEPFASASIGQVHRARLRHEQVWVAVKVRAPYAVESFLGDMTRAARWARWLHRFLPTFRLLDGVDELRRIMVEELDFRFEAAAMRRMRSTLKPHGIYVPKLYGRYSSDEVLVSELIDGALMADYLTLLDTDPAAAGQWCTTNRVKPKRLAWTAMGSLFRQILEDNRFHGDLHPGNLIIQRRSRLVLVDFGTTSSTDVDMLAVIRDQMRATAAGQYQRAADLCLQLGGGLPPDQIPVARAALVQAMQTWAAKAEIKSLAYHEKSSMALSASMMDVMAQTHGYMQWAGLRIFRAMATLDASLAKLWPAINFQRVVQRYFAEAAARVQLVSLASLAPQGSDLVTLIAERGSEYLRHQAADANTRAIPVTG